jgi:uncharacterized protein (DUF302 family)
MARLQTESGATMKSALISFAILAMTVAAGTTHAEPKLKAQTTAYSVTYHVKAKFSDVREQISTSIQNKGLRINDVSYIGKMLTRTGKDLGYKKVVFLHAQAFQFCSATISRFMMEANPHHIVFCPYSIAVYELPSEPGTVYVSYERLPMVGDAKSRKTLKAVNTLLDGIVRDALSWF